LRAELGEDKFWQIANVNPKKYLYGWNFIIENKKRT
jgi:hypothetical protein